MKLQNSLPYQRKIRNYVERKDSLTTEYLSLREKIRMEDSPEHELENAFEVLLRLDELLYDYHVKRAYLEYSRIELVPENRLILEHIDRTIHKLERIVPIPLLVRSAPKLAIFRRQLFESAREAAKILAQTESSNPDAKKYISPESLEIHDHRAMRIRNLMRFEDGGWSKDHVEIIYDAARLKKYKSDRCEYIKTQFERKFKVNISIRTAMYLLTHYGFNDTNYRIKDFRKAFDQAYALHRDKLSQERTRYIIDTVKELIGIEMTKNDAQYGAKLRDIFTKVYGVPIEPPENCMEFITRKFEPL
ncbi:uncharacterized protein SPAPADRAFT_54467 [Spathaspora passalidarum NRRL Y-27907]|uniref:Uncharacterized protein n=1 Tax=Spathaspora passalidarum (strain NRRL Y-27907 / 11-Y1) TaxID=619300 RepID=G3AI00_SPAPN|nr:uncharacterized protein SPAPADRAFT_54467 [Spathaspora passalidarum NRRL Y-27907]EGW34314.1 hypothetical protein SPAPADRAFT_54467 [Spathaspora passalidarum NRRL Y-27907]